MLYWQYAVSSLMWLANYKKYTKIIAHAHVNDKISYTGSVDSSFLLKTENGDFFSEDPS